jgi:hypothetical protein
MSVYKRRNPTFDARLVFIANTLEANAADDAIASLLKSIHRIASLASDYRAVYCDAVRRAQGGK